MNTTKQHLIDHVYNNIANLSLSRMENKRLITETINQFFEVIKDNLAQGKRIELRGFGTFYTKTRKARPVRNPRTGEEVKLPERRVPLLRFAKGMIRA